MFKSLLRPLARKCGFSDFDRIAFGGSSLVVSLIGDLLVSSSSLIVGSLLSSNFWVFVGELLTDSLEIGLLIGSLMLGLLTGSSEALLFA